MWFICLLVRKLLKIYRMRHILLVNKKANHEVDLGLAMSNNH